MATSALLYCAIGVGGFLIWGEAVQARGPSRAAAGRAHARPAAGSQSCSRLPRPAPGGPTSMRLFPRGFSRLGAAALPRPSAGRATCCPTSRLMRWRASWGAGRGWPWAS